MLPGGGRFESRAGGFRVVAAEDQVHLVESFGRNPGGGFFDEAAGFFDVAGCEITAGQLETGGGEKRGGRALMIPYRGETGFGFGTLLLLQLPPEFKLGGGVFGIRRPDQPAARQPGTGGEGALFPAQAVQLIGGFSAAECRRFRKTAERQPGIGGDAAAVQIELPEAAEGMDVLFPDWRYLRSASVRFFSTYSPFSYMMPRLKIAVESPASAPRLYHSNPSFRFRSTPHALSWM